MSDSKSPWYVANSPELGKPFEEFYQNCMTKGALDRVTKELLMTALACVFRCPHCTETHIRGALEAGATKEQVTEALLIAAVEGAGTQLAWNKDVFMKYLA
jgi:AhpD family alkylhydroperoxidase